MNPEVKGFRSAASQVCSRSELVAFYDNGLEELLDEAQAQGWDSLELEAQRCSCSYGVQHVGPRHC
jgi:hypothetical protein